MHSDRYEKEFRYDATTSAGDAEAWAREVFEGPPLLVRLFLAVGWRWVLRLRLAARHAPESIAGWPIAERTPGSITMRADSPLIAADNRAEMTATGVRWVTIVDYHSRLGRLLWAVAAPIHQATIPLFLRRADKRLRTASPR